jgi:hypothetical protein
MNSENSEPFPLLVNLTEMTKEGIIRDRLERRYRRLCAVSEELERLDFKKAKPGASFDDFVFESADFAFYQRIDEESFHLFYEAGLEDFSRPFFKNNFGIDRPGAGELLKNNFEKSGGFYHYQGKNLLVQSLLLSILRTLRVSLEWVPLVGMEELTEELKRASLPGIPGNYPQIFRFLILNLDHTTAPQRDGSVTTLFISPEGDLRGAFRPGNKPWTLTLIPAGLIPPLTAQGVNQAQVLKEFTIRAG